MRLSPFLIGPLAICLAGCGGSSTPPKITTTPPAPPAPADFSLSVTPSSQTLVRGTTGTALSLQATATNGFASPVTVDISGLPASVTASPASLTLTPGSAQNVT